MPDPDPISLGDATLQLEAAGALLGPDGRGNERNASLATRMLREAARLALAKRGWLDDLPRAMAAGGLRTAEASAVRTLLEGGGPPDLALAEAAVTHLVHGCLDTSPWPGRLRRYRLAVAIALTAIAGALVALVVMTPSSFRPSDDYRFRASSAEQSYVLSGRLGDHGPFDLVFHTKREDRPWVVIDLGAARTISRVDLKQRLDCCTDRGLPLVVEVSDDEERWTEVARRTDPITDWTASFEPQSVRYVRLRALSKTFLHFRDVDIQ